jgi:hypothetical protein
MLVLLGECRGCQKRLIVRSYKGEAPQIEFPSRLRKEKKVCPECGTQNEFSDAELTQENVADPPLSDEPPTGHQ